MTDMIVISATVDGKKAYLAGMLDSGNLVMTSSILEAQRFPSAKSEDFDIIENVVSIMKKYYPDAQGQYDDLDIDSASTISTNLLLAINEFNKLAGDSFSAGWTTTQMKKFDDFTLSLSDTERKLKTFLKSIKF